jgi:trans-aconitate 2-methyltransferase
MSGDRTGQLGSGSVYSFGETDLAAERLRVVSEVFNPTSEAFVSETVRNRPRLALDLGCGPGFTTRLLSRIARPERTVGVDRSESFLGRARASSVAREEYVAADVAMEPLRVAGIGERPDLIYARFLASHLPEPERAISGWAKTLEAGGLLLVEEVEGISTEAAAFEEYLKMVSEVLARHGNELFVGARLATARWGDDLRTEVNRATQVRPSTGQAARMFSMNLPNWRHDPYVEATYTADELKKLAAGLDKLTGLADTGRIVWRMRQLSLRRHPA